MKTLKKILSLVLVVAVMVPVAVLFAGCSVEGKKYQMQEISFEETTYTRKDLKAYAKDDFDYKNATEEEQEKAEMYASFFSVTWEFKKDGVIEATADLPQWAIDDGAKEEDILKMWENMKWKETDETVELYAEYEGVEVTVMKLTKDGLKLSGEISMFGEEGIKVVLK